jgi:hypothetical protein
MPPDDQEAVYTTLPPKAAAAAATISRTEAMTAFLEAPFLLDASQIRIDHITALLALILEDPLRSAAIRMICKSYTPEDFSYIWSQWEPHIQLPPSRSLAEEDRVRDHILTMLQAAYTTPKLASKDIEAVTYLVSEVIPVESCILFTAVTLREEEMVVYTPPHPQSISGLLTLRPFINGAFATVFAPP